MNLVSFIIYMGTKKSNRSTMLNQLHMVSLPFKTWLPSGRSQYDTKRHTYKRHKG
jgi:hypothetical protein